MKIYNSLTRKKQDFTPLHKGEISMYVCGPTVYDVGHLGHARSAVSFDIIRRYFLYKGFRVTCVSNITDVDDKMIKRAVQEKITEAELAQRIIPEYQKDYGALHVLPADHSPRATQYIPHMVALIEKLMTKGVAYETEDGIYFEVNRFKEYGKLSHQKLSELQAGARIAVDEKKKNPEDFALWKGAKPGEPAWDGPHGAGGEPMKGRPGWHIECSAMSMHLLGETFDIHGGGIDLMFPHHEDEIAQSEMATGKEFARFWLHNGHIQVNKEKMSKSLGNFFTIKEILAQYNPLVVRYFLLSTHYRMPIDFTDALLEQAKNSLQRLHDFMRRLQHEKGVESNSAKNVAKLIAHALHDFDAAMDDDFEIASALATIFDFIKEINLMFDEGKISPDDINVVSAVMHKFDEVLGVLDVKDTASEEIEQLISERNAARSLKNFARADEIREQLEKQGIILEDTPSGTLWKRAL